MSWICIKRGKFRPGKPDEEVIYLSDYRKHQTRQGAIIHGVKDFGDQSFLIGRIRFWTDLQMNKLIALFEGDKPCSPKELAKAKEDLDL